MYMLLTCHCISCNALMCCNPDRVPSIRVEGKREPLCLACFNKWNEIHRTSQGLEARTPHPSAYGAQYVGDDA